MQKLQSKQNEGKFAILLNHRLLINEAYSAAVPDCVTYELKPQLFQFKPKETKKPEEGRRRRKRKLVKPANNAATDNVIEYLDLLPTPEVKDESELPRHWEDEYALPQFHGSNTSGKFQEFLPKTDSSGKFLIPPNTCFFNHNVDNLGALLPQLLPSYDFIVLDPPWRNKYIRRLKRAKPELGYAMMDNDQLALLPLDRLTHRRTLVAIWCTNSGQHKRMLETELLPRWKLRLVHKLRWYKLNTEHKLIGDLYQADANQKQPYEVLYIACHEQGEESFAAELLHAELLLSIPSMVHSHKPPLLQWLRPHLQLEDDQTEPHCLELFARYLQPHFTSIGLEVLKLMDHRLYERVV